MGASDAGDGSRAEVVKLVKILRKIDALLRPSRKDQELDEELRFHLSEEEEERIESGSAPVEARHAARQSLGNPSLVKEEMREVNRFLLIDLLLRNIHFAFRTFRKHSGAYAFAICVLALGIGMSTAVFSLVQAVLLRPLPFPQQDSIRVIWKEDRKTGVSLVELGYPELHDLQGVKAFESVAMMPTTLYGYGRIIQVGSREPVQVESTPVSHDFFRTLGVTPMLGRDFTSSDEHIGAARVAILSYGVWQRHFDADPAIAGKQIRMNGAGCTVIGVMGPQIDFPRNVGMWVPLGINQMVERRDATYLQAIARVRPGFSDSQVDTQVSSLFTRQAQDYREFYSPAQRAVVTSLPRYWTGSARPQLLISLGASLLLLATACVTASNLFLSRILARGPEIATRVSLGASSGHIVAQFVTEGLAAGLIAGAAGLAIGWALIKMLILAAPANIPRLADAHIDRDVLLFAVVLSLLTALACSIVPAMIATRSNLDARLRESASRLTGTRRGRRTQAAFTLVQTAITVVLLTASLLIVITVHSMLTVDTGFANRNVVTMNLALRSYSDSKARDRFYTNLLDRLRESPSVSDAAGVLLRPLEGSIGWDVPYQAEFEPSRRLEELPVSTFEVVTPGYFRTIGTSLLEGRDFTDQDKEGAEQTAIVGRRIAERFRRMGHNPIGTRIRFGRSTADNWVKIVGVVEDTRQRGMRITGDDIYVPYLQTGIPVNYLVIRGNGSVQDLTSLVRREVAKIDPDQTIAQVETISQLVDRDTARERFNMLLLLTFGAGALLLAAAGVYSVMVESVLVRKREIAIRIALGADPPGLVGKLVKGTLHCVLLGELVGLLFVIASGRFAAELLYGVSPGDLRVLGSVMTFLLVVAGIAALIPAWMATKQNPQSVLQGD